MLRMVQWWWCDRQSLDSNLNLLHLLCLAAWLLCAPFSTYVHTFYMRMYVYVLYSSLCMLLCPKCTLRVAR